MNLDFRGLQLWWADSPVIEKFLIIALAISCVVWVVAAVGVAFYVTDHHCLRTGQSRLGSLQKIGDAYYPVTSYEYRCDGNEIIWVP